MVGIKALVSSPQRYPTGRKRHILEECDAPNPTSQPKNRLERTQMKNGR